MAQSSSNPAPGELPEPWLRGTLSDVPAEMRAVLHALELAREDITRWCAGLTDEELAARPSGLAPIAFHLRHIAGSLDRLLTYAEQKQLSAEHKSRLAEELGAPVNKDELWTQFESGLSAAESRIRAIPVAQWPEPRVVGRRQLPTTVAGLLIHCADHTQRHTGQAVTTAKLLLATRRYE